MMRFVIILFVAFGFQLQAQIACTNYNSSNSGLPDNNVYAVTTDTLGNVWCGTDGGLSKFDGTLWTTYTTANGLAGNSVRSVFCAPDGKLWIGTFFSGISVFDGDTFKTYSTQNSGLPSDVVKAFAFQPPSTIWIATTGGLARYKNDTITAYDLSSYELLSNHVTSVAVKPNGVKVIGLLNGGFAYYNDTTFNFYTHGTSNLPDNTILGITLDDTGNPYFAMPQGGIAAHFGGNIWQVYNTVLNPSQLTNSFKCITNAPGGIWAGSFDKGIFSKTNFAFDNQTNWSNGTVIDTIINTIHVPKSAFQQQVFNAWVGSENAGLYKLDAVTGLDETPIDKTLLVAFNETQMLLTAKSNIQQIAIYTMDGRIVAEAQNIGANKTAINLPQLSSGQIVMRCVTTDGIAFKKFFLY